MSNKVVDWSKPIEAYHEDGRVVAVTFMGRGGCDTMMIRPELDDGSWSFNLDGGHMGPQVKWRIRNVEPQEPPLWAVEKVLKKANSYINVSATPWTVSEVMNDRDGLRYAGLVKDFARYIAEHEEAPVDRVEALADEFMAQLTRPNDTLVTDFARWLHDKGLLREVGE